ncbi:MAG TPA: tetratricopeptide repeat protein [Pseudonocardiaceae bacterium]|nr:tetratricopeptide repeat protein [Pseudonocardiaceae bacterium]
MTHCPKPDCGASIGEDGYCTRCGTAVTSKAGHRAPALTPATIADRTATSRDSATSPTSRGSLPGSRSRSGSRRDEPVGLPPVHPDEHLVPLHENPKVPEEKRFCSNPSCRRQVGRSRHGRPGLVEGYCPQCGTEFSFRPPLSSGSLVGDGQFEIIGAIRHGGLGWVYQAWDRRVEHWVVLKGLIDPDDPDKRRAAVAELNALAKAKHPNIVTVHSVVTHPHPRTGNDVDYIVMEYLNGPSLKQLHVEHREKGTFLPVAQICEFTLEILAALEHLHGRGLLYCDVSADNVIHSTVGVKLIDLGAVRPMDDQDSPVWGKRGFQDPQIATHGPSVGTDLYSVGRMMAFLGFPFPGFSDGHPIPDPDEVELLRRYPSLYGLLRRATHPDRQRRFASAAEMAEQLYGVLREVRAQDENQPFPATSVLFGPELRVVGADPDVFPTEIPDVAAAALALPDPRVDPADPHAGLLAAISAHDPGETERVLTQLPDPSPETRLRVLRARIELRRPGIDGELDALAGEWPGDWRVHWFRGLWSLVDGAIEPARESFTEVLDALPGEAAPKLALGLCAERTGDTGLATRCYRTVWRTDRSYVSAAFGLARTCFAQGDRIGTAAALEAVPESSRYGARARLCALLARHRDRPAEQPPVVDFFTTAQRLHTLDLDERQREQAIAEVLEYVLGWQLAGRPWPDDAVTTIPDTLLGHPLSLRGVRDGLEAVYRRLARLAPTRAERISLIDKANQHRNRSWT